MIIDGVAYLGHWPFRELRNNSAETMAALMDRIGVDKACVSSINAVFYKDVMTGNRELMKELRPFRDRFVPFAVLNPVYPGFERDFHVCVDELGMRGVELFPGYHGYGPDAPGLAVLLRMAAEAKLPVRLPARLVDIRGRHWLDAPENLEAEQIEKIVSLCAETDFLLCSCNTAGLAKRLGGLTRSGRLLYDFARLDLFSYSPAFQSLLEAAGADSIFLGTGMPFQYPEVQQLKLHFLSEGNAPVLAGTDLAKIQSGNLAALGLA